MRERDDAGVVRFELDGARRFEPREVGGDLSLPGGGLEGLSDPWAGGGHEGEEDGGDDGGEDDTGDVSPGQQRASADGRQQDGREDEERGEVVRVGEDGAGQRKTGEGVDDGCGVEVQAGIDGVELAVGEGIGAAAGDLDEQGERVDEEDGPDGEFAGVDEPGKRTPTAVAEAREQHEQAGPEVSVLREAGELDTAGEKNVGGNEDQQKQCDPAIEGRGEASPGGRGSGNDLGGDCLGFHG